MYQNSHSFIACLFAFIRWPFIIFNDKTYFLFTLQ